MMRPLIAIVPNVLMASIVAILLICSPVQKCAFAQQSSEALSKIQAPSDWLQADLALDNSGYAATRKQIDNLIRGGQKPAILEYRYRLSGNDRYDSQKIFRWAYAAYRKQKLSPDQNVLSGVDEAMDRNLRPGAYDWVRLRFLLTSLQQFLRPTMQLIDVGRRLLKVKRDDEEVMFHFVRNLSVSEILEDRKQSIPLARAGARKHPKDFYWQWTVANAVQYADDYAGMPTYKGSQLAIVEYKKVLQLLPPAHPYRQRIIETIVLFQSYFDSQGRRAKWTKEGYKEALRKTTLR